MELEKVLNQIKDSKFYREIEEKEQDNIIEKRQRLAAEMEQLDKEALSAAIAHRNKIEKAEAEIADLKNLIKQKKTKLFKLEGDSHTDSHQFDCKKRDCQKALEDSADSLIDDAIDKFEERRAEFRRGSLQGNSANLIACIRTGIDTLKSMKLEPVLDEKKLQKLLSELPDIKDIRWN